MNQILCGPKWKRFESQSRFGIEHCANNCNSMSITVNKMFTYFCGPFRSNSRFSTPQAIFSFIRLKGMINISRANAGVRFRHSGPEIKATRCSEIIKVWRIVLPVSDHCAQEISIYWQKSAQFKLVHLKPSSWTN